MVLDIKRRLQDEIQTLETELRVHLPREILKARELPASVRIQNLAEAARANGYGRGRTTQAPASAPNGVADQAAEQSQSAAEVIHPRI